MTPSPSKTPGRPIFYIIPGTLFWGLIITGGVTENKPMIGVAVVLLLVTVITAITLQLRAHGALVAARKAIWNTGTPARARVVTLKPTGASINRHPEVVLELEVTLPGQEPYRTEDRTYVHTIAIPRVQPDCSVDVRVAGDDRNRVVLDPSLCAGGHNFPE